MSTPVRRMTRAASRASQTPGPIAATPGPQGGPRRRARVQPVDDESLPALPTGQNFSYGSRGRVELGEQIRRGGGSGLFEEQFGAARSAAVRQQQEEVDEADDDDEATASPPPRKRGRPPKDTSRAASAAPSDVSRRSRRSNINVGRPISEEGGEEDELLDSIEVEDESGDYVPDLATSTRQTVRNDAAYSITGIDESFSYVAPDASHYTTRSRKSAIAKRLEPPATAEEIEAARPWFTRVLSETIPKWWNEASPALRGAIRFAIVSPFLFSLLLFLHSLLPSNIDIIGAVQGLADSIGEQAARARNATMYNTAFDHGLHARVDAMENDFKDIQVQWSQFRDVLPEQFMVSKNTKTGTWDIPPAFWTAIESKLNSDYSLTPGSHPGASPAWETFITSNQKKIDNLLSTSANEATRSHLSELSSSGTIVSKEMFMSALEEHTSRIRKELSVLRLEASRSAKTIASSIAASHPSRQTPSTSKAAPAYLEDMTLLTLARNHLLFRERNFLSPGIGAVVDPHLTSPTFRPPWAQPNIIARLWTAYSPFASSDASPLPLGPTAALLPWTEAGECWCASRSTSRRGAAQIAALLVAPIEPSALVIEHVPAVSTLEIEAAPRDVEIWGLPAAAVPDITVPPAVPLAPPLSDAERAGDCEDPAPEPGRDWICLGTASYDVHALNWVQSFGLEAKGRLVDKVVVRVMGNWGGEKTCVYRFRMLGRTEEEVRGEAE